MVKGKNSSFFLHLAISICFLFFTQLQLQALAHSDQKQDDKNLDSMLVLARKLRQSDSINEAISVYRETLKSFPDSLDAVLGLGLLLSWQGEYNESLQTYQEAIAKHPSSRNQIELEIARVLSWKGELARSVATYRSICERDPKNLAAKLGYAQATAWNGQLRESIAEYQNILKEEQSIEAKLGLARTLSWNNQLNKSLQVYREIIESEPEHLEAKLGMAQVLLWSDQLKEAQHISKTLLDTHPNNLSVLSTAASIERAMGNYNEALKLANRAVAQKPDYKQANQLIQDIRNELSTQLTNQFNYYHDNDGLSTYAHTATVLLHLPARINGSFVTTSTWLTQNNRSNFIEAVDLKFRMPFKERAAFTTNFGGSVSSANRGGMTFGAGLDYQINPKIYVRTGFERRYADFTTRAVDLGVYYDTFSADASFSLINNFTLDLSASHARFSVNTERTGGLVAVNRKFRFGRYLFSGGYSYRVYGYSKDVDGGFFDPSLFQQHSSNFSLTGPLMKEWLKLRIDGSFGAQRIQDQDTTLARQLNLVLETDPKHPIFAGARFGYFQVAGVSGAFLSRVASGYLTVRF